MEDVFSSLLSQSLFLLPAIFVHGFTGKLLKIVEVINQLILSMKVLFLYLFFLSSCFCGTFAQSTPDRIRGINHREVNGKLLSHFPDSLREASMADKYLFHAALLPASASDHTTLYIFSPSVRKAWVGIYDLGDHCVWKKKVGLTFGENAVPLALYQLPEDWYWLRLEYGTKPEIYYFPLLIDR